MNRIALFSFYDNQGTVDNYVIYLLDEIKKYCSEIHCIVNGFLTEESEAKLKNICNSVTTRENKGFDAWGYKTLMEKLGYDKLKEFDETLCFNHTCFAPIDSFEPMFSKMESEECDFWGLYFVKAPGRKIYNQGTHIPSYFVAYRKSLTEKPEFKEFWDNLPEITNYDNAVKFYEQSQTPFFEGKGFKVKAAFDLSKYENLSEWWFLEYQAEMLIEDKLPLLKRRPFFRDKYGVNGKFYKKVLPYIKSNTNYDVKLILENIERTQKISEIRPLSLAKNMWYKFLSKFSLSAKKRKKYKDRLEMNISKEELMNLFL